MVPVDPVPVVDPTGAGDAFAAAYLLAQLAGLDPARRLAVGNACGALAVGVTGARSRPASLPDLFRRLPGEAG
jgi:ribokinase